jgi:hypothetical protein
VLRRFRSGCVDRPRRPQETLERIRSRTDESALRCHNARPYQAACNCRSHMEQVGRAWGPSHPTLPSDQNPIKGRWFKSSPATKETKGLRTTTVAPWFFNPTFDARSPQEVWSSTDRRSTDNSRRAAFRALRHGQRLRPATAASWLTSSSQVREMGTSVRVDLVFGRPLLNPLDRVLVDGMRM